MQNNFDPQELLTLFRENAVPAETVSGHRWVYRLCLERKTMKVFFRSDHESCVGHPRDEHWGEVVAIPIGYGVPELDLENAEWLADKLNACYLTNHIDEYYEIIRIISDSFDKYDGSMPKPKEYADDDYLFPLAEDMASTIAETITKVFKDYTEDWEETNDGITTVCRVDDLSGCVESILESKLDAETNSSLGKIYITIV